MLYNGTTAYLCVVVHDIVCSCVVIKVRRLKTNEIFSQSKVSSVSTFARIPDFEKCGFDGNVATQRVSL